MDSFDAFPKTMHCLLWRWNDVSCWMGNACIARRVAQQHHPPRHGLLLAIGEWHHPWCEQHVRLMGFNEMSGKQLQQHFMGHTISEEVVKIITFMTVE